MKKIYLLLALCFTLFTNAQSFHDTQGKLEVSSSGQASYTLPIAMPPSIQNVGPTINLIYGSGQMGGIAGQGWSLSSISNISRMATRKDIDGFVDGVDFDDNDKLALDGQRLILVPGTGDYWADGSEYKTEVQSNSKIQLFGTGVSIYFAVTAPDGSKSWYGNGSINSDTNAFYIYRFEDVKGNIITYSYIKPFAKSLCISEIKFSVNSNGNPTALNKIVFTYKQSIRTENAYIKGTKIEKGELLDKIEVFTNSQLFRKYQLTHVADPQLGYERVSQLQEFNGAGEAANPAVFEYNQTSTTNAETVKNFVNNIDLTSVKLSGDFDGDGRVDFVTENQMYLKLFEGNNGTSGISVPYASGDNDRFTATTLSNNKLNQFQSLVYTENTIDKINYKVYNLVNGVMQNTYTKSILMDNSATCESFCSIKCRQPTYTKGVAQQIEGDFNGDGVSEVLVFGFDETKTYSGDLTQPLVDGKFPITCYPHQTYNLNTQIRLIDLNENSSTVLGQAGNLELPNTQQFFKYEAGVGVYMPSKNNIYVSDFNGDGKMDIFLNFASDYRILTLKESKVAPFIEVETIGEGTLDANALTRFKLFGDFNGDGKTDLIVPQGDGLNSGNPNWDIFYSNPNPIGGSSFTKDTKIITDYWPDSRDYYSLGTEYNSYYALDTNKDGKTDIVKIYRNVFKPKCTINDHDTLWKVTSFANNLGNASNNFTLDYSSPTSAVCLNGCPYQANECYYDHYSDSPEIVTPIVSSFKFNGLNQEIAIIRNHTKELTYINFTKDVSIDNTLKKVTQAAGAIVDEIQYSTMETSSANNGLGNFSDFYSSTDGVNYPMIEAKQLPSSRLVSKLKNIIMGTARYQDFKYHGYLVNLQGLGTFGFRATARSSWYKSSVDRKTWSASYIDPSKRGATVLSYSQLLNGNVNFEFNPANTTGLLSKIENTFNQSTTNDIYAILLDKQTTTDYLTNVVTEKIFNSYIPIYNLPERITTNNYLGTILQGSSAKTTTYAPNSFGTGTNYYIGRPIETFTTISAYGDTKTSSEKVFYTGANVTRTERKPNNDPVTMVEEMEYFPNGNLKKKTISATGTTIANQFTPRSTQYTYDPTARFVQTLTDADNMVTISVAFDPIYGTVLEQKNPYNQTTKSFIDAWGKNTKVTDFLGKSIVYSYVRANGTFTTTQTGDDGTCSVLETDEMGRETRKGSKDINGNWIYKNSEYDYFDRKYRESEPYFATATPTQWSTSLFDDYNRVTKVTSPTGREANMWYAGLQVTTNDGIMTKSVTKDANGMQISNTDTPGGTINYKYDAASNMLETDYDGIKTKMTYDNWGRKLTLDDTSAGLYNYTYFADGQINSESNLKGTTTYTYTPVGKILTKTIIGATTEDATNMVSTYTYDPEKKWLNSMTVVNAIDGNSIFNYTYDIAGTNPTYQLNQTEEITQQAVFTKTLTFDNFGRVLTEKSKAFAHSKTSEKVIVHEYKNGMNYRMLDATATGTILWQTDTENARGQLTNAILGNGIAVTNSYDAFGFPTQIKHDLVGTTPVNVMTLNTSFDVQRGNLKSRYNSMFNYPESFGYDANDRLTTIRTTGALLSNATFTSTVDGFSYSVGAYGNGTPAGTAVLNTGKLKVTATKDLCGAKKQILINTTIGKVIRIEAEVLKQTGNGIVVAVVRERDPITLEDFETRLGEVGTGASSFEYTTQTNSNVTLYFEVAEAVVTLRTTTVQQIIDPGNGTPIQKATYTIDNVKITNIDVDSQNYDERGRITDNNVGQYFYTSTTTHPYQNTSIAMLPQAEAYYNTHSLQDISYNAFKSPIQIKEQGFETINFGYNAMGQRQIMYFGDANTDKTLRPFRRYYSADGSMEVTFTKAAGTVPESVEFVTYIGGDAYSSAVLLKSNGTTQNYFYLHRDNQNSILAITNATGAVVEKRLFDPWGAVIAVQNGAGVALAKLTFFDRGYTGHEHLQGVGLINMNARLYDAKLHRFLQADNFVQDLDNTQNYNRYAYCLNNPLRYTDPSGNIIPIVAAVLMGAVIGAVTYTLNALLSDVPFSVGGLAQSIIISAGSSALTAGVGAEFTSICGFASSGVGFMNGFFIGATTGFVTGVTGSAISQLISNGSIQLGQLLKDGGIAALTQGLIQGISAGISAQKLGLKFWNGKGKIIQYSPLAKSNLAVDQEYTSTYDVRTDYNNNIGKLDNLTLEEIEDKLNTGVFLATKENTGYSIDNYGLIETPSGTAGGINYVRYEGGFINSPSSQIAIAPAVGKYGLNVRNMVFKHEFMHAWHWNSGVTDAAFLKYSERAASTFSYAYLNAYGESEMANIYLKEMGSYSNGYSWRKFNKIVPLWIK